ncbi:hypothetical protein E2120_27295, partial [Escherichia coli]
PSSSVNLPILRNPASPLSPLFFPPLPPLPLLLLFFPLPSPFSPPSLFPLFSPSLPPFCPPFLSLFLSLSPALLLFRPLSPLCPASPPAFFSSSGFPLRLLLLPLSFLPLAGCPVPLPAPVGAVSSAPFLVLLGSSFLFSPSPLPLSPSLSLLPSSSFPPPPAP